MNEISTQTCVTLILFFRVGCVTTTTTAVTAQTKAKNATLNTKPAHLKNLPVKISNVFACNIVVTVKTIAVTTPTK